MKQVGSTRNQDIIFFAKVAKEFSKDWEYYQQDIRLLTSLSYNVIVCTNYLEVLRKFWSIKVIYAWWWHRSLPIIILARLFGKKIVVTGAIHAFDLSNAPSFYKKNFLYRITNVLGIRLATANLCISKHQLQSLKMITNTNNLTLLYPSVYKRCEETDYKPRTYNQILSICWLTEEQCTRKGIYEIINCLGAIKEHHPKLLDDVNVVIGGKDGNGVSKLKKMIVEKRLENIVKLQLNLTEEEKYSLFTSSDLLLAPSAMEGFGNATLEGMSVGLPALVTSEGASKEVVGNAGLVCLGIEGPEIQTALIRFLNLTDKEKNQLKRNALYRANNCFSFEKRIEAFTRIINDKV